MDPIRVIGVESDLLPLDAGEEAALVPDRGRDPRPAEVLG